VVFNEDKSKGGTSFFDDRKRLRGTASLISRRNRALSDLTVIDVVGAEPELIEYLSHLDRSRLVLREPGSGETVFNFLWASGYVNGKDIKVQGILDPS
jgi:hypothetical protein